MNTVSETEHTHSTKKNSNSVTLDMETFVSFRDLVSSIISKMTRERKSQARGEYQSKDLDNSSAENGMLLNTSGEILIPRLKPSPSSACSSTKSRNMIQS